MEKKPITELQAKLQNRMEKEGWDNLNHFATKSGITCSMETVRRAFNDPKQAEKVEPMSFALIMYHLGFKPNEIRDALREYTDDCTLHRIIGDQEITMTQKEIAVIGAFREVVRAKPEITHDIANTFDLIAKAAGTDIKFHSDQLRRVVAV